MKKNKRSNQSSYPQYKYFVWAVLLILMAFAATLVILNNRISTLENDFSGTHISSNMPDNTPPNPDLRKPACEQQTPQMSTSGGNGETITSLKGDMFTLEDQADSVFHICKNVKVYDVASGDQLDKNAIKQGAKVWIKANAGNYVTEVQIVSH